MILIMTLSQCCITLFFLLWLQQKPSLYQTTPPFPLPFPKVNLKVAAKPKLDYQFQTNIRCTETQIQIDVLLQCYPKLDYHCQFFLFLDQHFDGALHLLLLKLRIFQLLLLNRERMQVCKS